MSVNFMEAKQTKFLNLFEGTRQYIIPIYQRTYSWGEEQCEQLWKDVIKVGTDDKLDAHFVGSIVYIQKGIYQSSAVPQLLVIDGQQRLTTILLLLAALSQKMGQASNEGEITKEKIDARYLFNGYEKGDRKFKLLLTQSDKVTLMGLLEGKEIHPPISRRIVENFQLFRDKINKSEIDLQKIFNGISKLIVVDIALDREHDNPQRIFESMNSTGLRLSQADLIRNYVLMELEPAEQESIYNEFWFPMEQSFAKKDYSAQFDRFMRDYLTIKTRSIPNIDDVYVAFKLFAPGKKVAEVREVIGDVYKFSKYFVNLAFEKEGDAQILSAIRDLNALKIEVAYPFLLESYNDYKEDKLAKDDFVKMIRRVESYIFRRSICGIPTNSMNKTFATLGKEIDKENYLESATAVLQLKDTYRRFPGNDEFKRELTVKNVYESRNCEYWLRKLENFERKEIVRVEDFTIEHVMPQTLSDEWMVELGAQWKEIHQRYLHTIGNLTLTGYNSELSNRPFIEKRNMKGGFGDSPIRMNRSLASLEHWNEAEMQKRADLLAELAIKVWEYPQIGNEILDKYREKEKAPTDKKYTLDDHQYLKGPTRELFEQLRKRVLNLDVTVKEEILKLYIAYKTTTNFVDIVPQKKRLRITLNMKFDEVNDPKGICVDVTDKGRWGNGDVEVYLSSSEQLDDVMALIRQSFEKHAEDGED